MSAIDDQPLASDPSVDIFEAPTVTDFDFQSWLEGVRPTRRAVRLYARADLIGRMEEVAGEAADAEKLGDSDALAGLVDEMETLRETFDASARWFVVEARSPEWVDDFHRIRARDMGIKKGEPGERQKQQILLEQLAEQIVTPTGVTAEALAVMLDRAAGEVNKLIVAMTFANQQVADSAGVLKLDFSSRRPAVTPG